MNNIIRRIAAILLAASVCAGVFSLSGCSTEVNTYSVSDIAYIDSWIDTSESYGEVKTVNMQNVFLSETIQVKEIYVSQGDQVKAGDPLISYDTALTDIELEKKELEVKTLLLELQQAEQELRTVNSYKPMVITTIVPSGSDAVGTKISGCVRTGGTGTEEDPYIFVAEDGIIPCDGSFVETLCPPGTEKVWAAFQQRNENMTNGIIIDYWGICYSSTPSGTVMSFFNASDFCQNVPTEPYEEIEFNSGLTAGEISHMRQAARDRIKEADLKYRMAELDYQKMKLEIDGGVITAELDGTVAFVNDTQYAIDNFEPLLRVSNNGGYIVEGTLSELELSTVSVGQRVKITSWERYEEYEAEITSISTMPTVQNGWTNGNTNVSYYPFTVYIDESANLMEYEFVSVTYSSKGYADDCFYLERAFVLNENGSNYVFVQTEEGTLEKRRIEIGEILWGTYVRIASGLSLEDRIAFPYDKNAKDGAAAVEADISQLYSY